MSFTIPAVSMAVGGSPAGAGSAAQLQHAYLDATKQLQAAQKQLHKDSVGKAGEETIKADQLAVEAAQAAVAAASAAIDRANAMVQASNDSQASSSNQKKSNDERTRHAHSTAILDVYA